METTHRKIELQSPLDLIYLRNNTTSTAREKLDLHFPPSAAPESASDDVLRSRVEELVQQYISKVFENAGPNLAVNGLEGKEMEEAMRVAEMGGDDLEPYDSKLQTKLLNLSAKIENLTLQLANLRRTAPAQAAASYAATLEKEEKEFEEARQRAEEQRKRMLEEEGVQLGTEGVRDWGEAERNWEQATKGLVDIKEKIGETGARLVQARDAAAYLDQVGK
ncbi:hypothetical protein D6C76_07041 [Aureobasidium pullulans]|uniref:Uncharacterized protein n=1 Tax=Aureobasidium pullulans TaxID=5580 RepID=A0A4S8YFW4_AURPU|nr:hypothetical protein D6D22_01094 [Aureobasidium pullulans]TIA72017.1 hypothetical protein D6C76_07041 [Aureobasidium pullulans]